MPSEVPLEKKLDDLYDLIDGVEIAMLTTRRADGQLVSRPMRTQRRTGGTDLWFMTNVESEKFEELALDPHVNVSYFRERTNEWVSVSGRAIISRDRDLIDALYRPEWKSWLDTPGDAKRDGGPHDPRIALILVEADSVVYSKDNRRMPLALFQRMKGMITSEPAGPTDVRALGKDELHSPPGRPDLR
ncbi:MAG TPA: pyridoxamine 5'-phosphate oxidase family protein [Gemmatimonadaceae bacterium]|jgi:general stress protein 26|nr:pyridoxamine 5'-phosphate oxidase family protein [Gemmatimonadaceae bacterium]